MKRLGALTVALIAFILLAAWPRPAAAQAASANQPAVDKTRVEELLRYARDTYNQSGGQTTTNPQAQQLTLEQRAEARPVVRLGVEEAVVRAIQNNIELSVERLNPKLQDMQLESVRSVYKPTLTAVTSTSASNPPTTSQLDGGPKVTTKNQAWNANISQSLPWYGSRLTAAWNNTRTDTNNLNSLLNPQYQPFVTFTYTQPLWRNFKIDATRQSIASTQIAQYNSNVQLRAVLINTEANTRNAYWDYMISIRAVEAAKQSLALAEKLVEDNKIRVEIGTLAPIDIIQAQAEAATRRQTLTQVQATRRTTELALKRLIVASTDDPIWKSQIEPTDAVTLQMRPVDLEAAVTKALSGRTDVIQARKNLENNDISIIYLRNQLKPAMDAAVTYGLRGLGGTRGAVPGGYLDSLGSLKSFNYPNWTLSMTFSYPLGQSAADVSYARAKVQYQQAQAQIRALELTVATDVTNAALQVESTQRRLEASEAARQLSEKRLEAEQTKFDVGMQTNFFVVQAQRDLLDAQITELRSTLDYQKALVEFQRVQETSGSRGSVTSVSTGGTGGS